MAKIEAEIAAAAEEVDPGARYGLDAYMEAVGLIHDALEPHEDDRREALMARRFRMAGRLAAVVHRHDVIISAWADDEGPLDQTEWSTLNWWALNPEYGEAA